MIIFAADYYFNYSFYKLKAFMSFQLINGISRMECCISCTRLLV